MAASFQSSVVAIVAAMPEEMAPLRERASGVIAAHGIRCGGGDVLTARVAGVPVVLAVTGDGDRNARQGMASLLAAIKVESVIAIGVAGALGADLAPGSLVVCDRVARQNADALLGDVSLVELAARVPGARRGISITADHIIDTVAEKRRMSRAVDSGSTAVVDLESAAYAAAAAGAGIPWLVLRAVSDSAEEALPALLNRCRDEGGAVRRAKVAFELLGNPGALPLLLSLRQRVRQGAVVLADAVEMLLRSRSGSPEGLLARRNDSRMGV